MAKKAKTADPIKWKQRSFKDGFDFHWIDDGFVNEEHRFSMFCSKVEPTVVQFTNVRKAETFALSMGTKGEGIRTALAILEKDQTQTT